jgi:flagellar basal-body rod protein FlgC
MNMFDTMKIAGAGMKVQSDRLKVVSQNIANAESTGTRVGEEPYRRKTIAFKTAIDREMDLETVKSRRIGTDPSEFPKKYDPGHPAADNEGYVLIPNVHPLVERMAMREARRGYEANLNVIESSRSMIGQTLNLLR